MLLAATANRMVELSLQAPGSPCTTDDTTISHCILKQSSPAKPHLPAGVHADVQEELLELLLAALGLGGDSDARAKLKRLKRLHRLHIGAIPSG
eukprot:6174425-Alexandrium_andersonii.AAC.1